MIRGAVLEKADRDVALFRAKNRHGAGVVEGRRPGRGFFLRFRFWFGGRGEDSGRRKDEKSREGGAERPASCRSDRHSVCPPWSSGTVLVSGTGPADDRPKMLAETFLKLVERVTTDLD